METRAEVDNSKSAEQKAAVDRAHLLQVMRDFLGEAEQPAITVEAFCALAEVTPALFYSLFPDINTIQMELTADFCLVDIGCRQQANAAKEIVQRWAVREKLFWQSMHGSDFGRYERNLMRIGMTEYFQQTPESARLVREMTQSHWREWLYEAKEQEGFRHAISLDAIADFQGSMQTTGSIATGFVPGHSHKKTAADLLRIITRYLQRHIETPSLQSRAIQQEPV